MTLNISEYQRLTEEAEYWQSKVKNLDLSKTSRRVALINLRHIQRQLGVELTNEV